MFTPIGTYIPSFTLLPNIAPFTYKDGATYLSELDRLRRFINDDLVKFINDQFTIIDEGITVDINALITTVNTALDTQEQAVITLLNEQTTEVNGLLDVQTIEVNGLLDVQTIEVNSLLAAQTVANTTQINTAITELNESVTDAINQMNADLDPNVTAIVNNAVSDLRGALDTLYGGGGGGLDDAGVAALVSTAGTDTQDALDTRYLSTFYTSILTDSKFFLKYATMAAMYLDVTKPIGTVAIVDNIPGATHRKIGADWQMMGVPEFSALGNAIGSITSPKNNYMFKNYNNGTVYRYDGTSANWSPWESQSFAALPNLDTTRITLGNGILGGRAQFNGGWLTLEGFLQWGTTTAYITPTDPIKIYLPGQNGASVTNIVSAVIETFNDAQTIYYRAPTQGALFGVNAISTQYIEFKWPSASAPYPMVPQTSTFPYAPASLDGISWKVKVRVDPATTSWN